MPTRADLIDLVYDCPAEIAVKLGYDKLTKLHNDWIREMVFGTEDETIQAHRGSFKTTCLHISFAFILVLFPGERVIFMRKTDDDVAEVMTATANVLGQKQRQLLYLMVYFKKQTVLLH